MRRMLLAAALGVLGLSSCGQAVDTGAREGGGSGTLPPTDGGEVDQASATTSTSVADVVSVRLEWPEEAVELTPLERQIGLDGTKDPLDVYLERVTEYTTDCMAAGGFQLGQLLDEAGQRRLFEPVDYLGVSAQGGCDQWGQLVALPGNYFGSAYAEARSTAYESPEWMAIVAEYDRCLIAAGYDGAPSSDGLSDDESNELFDGFVAAADMCDEVAGRTEGERKIEMLAQTLLTERGADVDGYVALLRDLGAEVAG